MLPSILLLRSSGDGQTLRFRAAMLVCAAEPAGILHFGGFLSQSSALTSSSVCSGSCESQMGAAGGLHCSRLPSCCLSFVSRGAAVAGSGSSSSLPGCRGLGEAEQFHPGRAGSNGQRCVLLGSPRALLAQTIPQFWGGIARGAVVSTNNLLFLGVVPVPCRC